MLVLSKRSSEEMDFLATIIEAVDAIVVEYRRAHWRVQPLEDDPVVVPAQQRANAENLTTGSSILREALKVYGHVCEIKALRFNALGSFYPAAENLRTSLGIGVAESLETYRGAVTYLAFSTLRGKGTAGNKHPTELKAFLNENTTHMKTYISKTYGPRAVLTFRHIVDSLEEVIVGEKRQGIEVQQGWPMQFLLSKFRRQPIFWLMYNLHFPVEGRMSWDQVSMWVIQRLREINDIEPPKWPAEIPGSDGWDRDATAMWNEAVIEVYTDIKLRFCAIQKLHFNFRSV